MSEAWIGEGGRDALAVPLGDASGARRGVPGAAHPRLHHVNHGGGLAGFKQEAGTLREQVARVRETASIAALQRQIAPFHADRHCRGQVIGRGQRPLCFLGDQRMVARVIVDVRDQRVEAHAAEQLGGVLRRVRADTPDFFG